MYQYCKVINGLDLRHEPFYSTDCLTELSFPSSLPCPSLQPPLSHCVTRVLLPWAPNHSACSLDCVAPPPSSPPLPSPLLTGVDTMWGLSERAALTVWKMSTSPCTLTLSTSAMVVMNTPVRDMPSLWGEDRKERRWMKVIPKDKWLKC